MPPVSPNSDEAEAVRRLLEQAGERPSWRALERIADTPAFDAFVRHRHLSATPLLAGTGRRRFLQVMAASFALGGLTGCDREASSGYTEIVPYVNQPTGLTPGEPQSYTSATLLDGIANGALVTTIDGRPIKIEGNADHPWSRGGTDTFMQASVLGLYDPDRSQAVMHLANPSDWDTFRGSMIGRFGALQANHGRGFRILTGPLTSPSLVAAIRRMQPAMPEMHWHTHAPIGRDAIYAGAQQAFGKPLETQWDFSKTETIVSLDGDFLDPGPQQVGAAGRWIEARHAATRAGRLLAMHAVAPVPTLTYAKADHHTAVAQRDLIPLARALLAQASGAASGSDGPAAVWSRRAAQDLMKSRGRGMVVTGTHADPALHALVHQINGTLGNLGSTVLHTDPVVAQAEPIDDLLDAMEHGQVSCLLILDSNPVYSMPADARFGDLLKRVSLKIHAGLHRDETAVRCDWHLPLTHPLEAWGDARSLDGTATLIQPTIAPLYGGRSVPEILSMLQDTDPRSGYDILREFWRGELGDDRFAAAWRDALLAGFVRDTAFKPQQVTVSSPAPAASPAPASGELDVLIRPDPTIWDGAFANNAWMQELPKPWTNTVWQNVVALSPGRAAKVGLKKNDLATVKVGEDAITGPVWVVEGQHDDAVMVQLGYGRGSLGSVGTGIGYDAYALRSRQSPWVRSGATVQRASGERRVVTAQELEQQEGHDFVRLQPIGAKPVGDDDAFTQPTLYNRTANAAASDGRAWGMVIDLDACIGCNACVVACQSENNVPVVGEEQFAEGRSMHWLRVDHYLDESDSDPHRRFMPVPCMHCEAAPCELGCPVEATVHDHEGLNLMIYNRCVGTRACSSYCPYKVRHFNFLHYSEAPPAIQARRNPEVTVRARGVMEKCTYCVQRIVKARIAADIDDRPIRDGEVVTACASACPTRAITFGDLADEQSAVASARKDPRNYALLGELNTRPRTTYLAAVVPSDWKA